MSLRAKEEASRRRDIARRNAMTEDQRIDNSFRAKKAYLRNSRRTIDEWNVIINEELEPVQRETIVHLVDSATNGTEPTMKLYCLGRVLARCTNRNGTDCLTDKTRQLKHCRTYDQYVKHYKDKHGSFACPPNRVKDGLTMLNFLYDVCMGDIEIYRDEIPDSDAMEIVSDDEVVEDDDDDDDDESKGDDEARRRRIGKAMTRDNNAFKKIWRELINA